MFWFIEFGTLKVRKNQGFVKVKAAFFQGREI